VRGYLTVLTYVECRSVDSVSIVEVIRYLDTERVFMLQNVLLQLAK
jgi:hypothetical protein